ncbi:MgtC/SapB family protein [Archangium primigenium]|uniref:MgtC/SapB family protein n=1 Tax=[Archangium] primigenium TaxID=2792470 RepID=UPI001EF85E49|nr:MgtC/SapB family protein [Archangium primigenium]
MPPIDDSMIVGRLLVAFGLGFVLGFEREIRGQQAGLRTHMLVCLGACLFTLCSIFIAVPLAGGESEEIRADIGRIASQIVVGISFLGGGAILRQDSRIRGLTTAANLWLTASVGLATGLGFILAAVLTVLLALFTLVGLRGLEPLVQRLRLRLKLTEEDAPPPPSRPRDD